VDLRNMMRIIRGHPLIIVLGLVATLGISAMLVSQVKPEYEAKASVLLLTPAQVRSELGVVNKNPLENPQAVAVAGNALTEVMLSPPIAQRLASKGLAGSYEVVVNPNGGGAIISLRTTGETATAAFDGMDLVLTELSAELETIQSGFAQETRINDQPFNLPEQATPVAGSKARVLAISLSLGVIGTYGLAVLADLLYGERHPVRDRLRRRKGRHLAPKGPTSNVDGLVSESETAADNVLLDDLAPSHDDERDEPDTPTIRAV
jgi:capsular polysaccharide biosynthesis protein